MRQLLHLPVIRMLGHLIGQFREHRNEEIDMTLSRFRGMTLSLLVAATLLPHHAGAAPESGTGGSNARAVGQMTISGVGTGPIAINGYDWGIMTSVSGSGIATSMPSDFAVTRRNDTLTSKFAYSTAAQEHFADATIVIFAPGTTTQLVKYQLTNVAFSAHSAGDQGRSDGFPTEEIKMSYTQIKIISGTAMNCWDRVARARC